MADTLKRLYGPQYAPATPATGYTVPASTKTVLREIVVFNNDSSDRQVSISIGTYGLDKLIFFATLAPGQLVIDNRGTVLDTGETLQVDSDAASMVTVTISGVEIT